MVEIKKLLELCLLLIVISISLQFTSADTISSDDFECNGFNCGSGWNNAWITSGDCIITSLDTPRGSFHMRGQEDATGTCIADRNFSNSAYSSSNVSFWAKSDVLETGDFCRYYYFNGTAYNLLLEMTNGDDDNIYKQYNFSVQQYGISSNSAIRMRQFGIGSDNCYIDDILVVGSQISSPDTTPPLITINSPLNTTINTASPILNLTITEPNIDSIWISVDNSPNITYAHKNGTIDFGKLNLIFADDFENYPEGSDASPKWTNPPTFKTATIENKTYKLFNETAIIDALSYITNFNQLNYEASARVMIPSSTFGGAYLTPRFSDVNNKYEIALDYDFSSININKVVNGTWSNIAAKWTGDLSPPIYVSKNEWHTLGTKIIDNNISTYVDNQLALNVLDNDLSSTGFSIIAFDDVNNHTAYFDNIAINTELSYGSHTLIVYANDSSGNLNYTSVIFFINVSEKKSPLVTINFPSNKTYGTKDIPLNFNVSLNENGSVMYSLNSGTNNITMPSSTDYSLFGTLFNKTNNSIADGSYTFQVYANDTFGNKNYTEFINFKINTTAPKFYNLTENPINNTIYIKNQTYFFNVTISNIETGIAGIEFNNINYSISNISNTYLFNITDLSAGNYQYYWWANNSLGNYNATPTQYYTIAKAPSQIFLYLNNTRNNLTIVKSSSIEINSTLQAGEKNIQIYVNNSLIYDGSSPAYNITTFNDAGLYNITALYQETQNYSSSSETWFVNVVQNSEPIINENLTIVNNSIKIPKFGETFFFQVNLSDIENDSIIFVNFTLTSQNGTKVIDNLIGNKFNINNYSIWNSTNYTINDYGTWNWSYILSDGFNILSINNSFRVFSNIFIFPLEYITAPDPRNQTLIWNLSLYHLSNENYPLNFTLELNNTYFNTSLQYYNATINSSVYNASNLFNNQIVIKISNNIPDGIYFGNITIRRELDKVNFTLPLIIGINPPSGNIDAFAISGAKCSNNNCDIDVSMENDETKTFSWLMKNTGNNTLTNCIPNITGFNTANFGNFSSNNFNLGISEAAQLSFTISQPSINTYYGKLEVVCAATINGYNNSLGAENDNAPNIKLLVKADTGTSPTPAGGGASTSSGGAGGGAILPTGNISRELKILFSNPENTIIKRGTSSTIEIEATNQEIRFLNHCNLLTAGPGYNWLTNTQEKGFSSGEKFKFIISAIIPEDAETGVYEPVISLKCDEGQRAIPLKLTIFKNNFEAKLLNYEKLDNKLKVSYSLQEFINEDHEITLQYGLINFENISIVKGQAQLSLLAGQTQNYVLEFELPKDAFGEFALKMLFSDSKALSELNEIIVLGPPRGILGLAISEVNRRTLSIVGIFVLLSLTIFFASRIIYKKYQTKKLLDEFRKRHITKHAKKTIKLDLHN